MQSNTESAHKRLLPSYGRRRGRKLRAGKQTLMEELLPKLTIALPQNERLNLTTLFDPSLRGGLRPTKQSSNIDSGSPRRSAPRDDDNYWLEIGFGGGEHLAHMAALYPGVGIIGCEPYINGVGDLLRKIKEQNLTNIRIFNDDARLLMERLPDACLDKVFILYPDPWPKARHHKRRLISKETLALLARVMKPGAQLQLATDDADYASWMLENLLASPDFTWQAQTASDWLNPPPDWISTRYERKAIQVGRKPTYLNFLRIVTNKDG